MTDPAALIRAVAEYAWHVPPATVVQLAAKLENAAGLEGEAIVRIAAESQDPGVRHDTVSLLEQWKAANGGSPARLAALLLGASEAVRFRSGSESSHLVWTGPTSSRTSLRRTDEALLEVVRHARRVLTLVTFAAYRVAEVRSALEAALDRGIEVRFIGETERGSDGHLRFDAALALGPDLARRARLFEWPREVRAADARGRIGRLHAKCAIADDAALLVSSANLTEAAFGVNIEMGVLVCGGPLPEIAARHFEDLMRSRTLRPLG